MIKPKLAFLQMEIKSVFIAPVASPDGAAIRRAGRGSACSMRESGEASRPQHPGRSWAGSRQKYAAIARKRCEDVAA